MNVDDLDPFKLVVQASDSIRVQCNDSSHPKLTTIVGEVIREVYSDDTFTWHFLGVWWSAQFRKVGDPKDFAKAAELNTNLAAVHENGTTKCIDREGNLTVGNQLPNPYERRQPLPDGVHKTFEMKCRVCKSPLRVREPRLRPELERRRDIGKPNLSLAEIRYLIRAKVI